MKRLQLFFLLISFLLISSCTKCYECKTSSDTKQYCKGSAEYTVLKNGGVITANNGETYTCNLK